LTDIYRHPPPTHLLRHFVFSLHNQPTSFIYLKRGIKIVYREMRKCISSPKKKKKKKGKT
jgi:hypothetical protein